MLHLSLIEERTNSRGNRTADRLIREEGRWHQNVSTGHLRKKLAGQRSHEHFALREEDGRRVGGEVLSDVQMDVQGVGEQRCGLIGLFEHSVGHLFLIEGIATFDNRRPREVIAISKQI